MQLRTPQHALEDILLLLRREGLDSCLSSGRTGFGGESAGLGFLREEEEIGREVGA